ncbi:MAG: hypothetical protein ACRDYV_03575, partial [Acidimicrobiia bacterium]
MLSTSTCPPSPTTTPGRRRRPPRWPRPSSTPPGPGSGPCRSWPTTRRSNTSASNEALDLARRLEDPACLAHVILARCSAIFEPATARERLENTEELLGVAAGLADPAVLAWAHIRRCIFATGLADLGEAARSLDQVRSLSRELGQPGLSWVAGYLGVAHTMVAGRLDRAEALALETRELGLGAGEPDAAMFYGGQRFYIRYDQGRLHELVERLAGTLEHAESPSVSWPPRSAVSTPPNGTSPPRRRPSTG